MVMVRAGWNTELGRIKWDCEQHEEDLKRCLLENGLDPSIELLQSEAFWILHFSAELFSDVTKARLYQDAGGEDNEQRAMALLAHAQKNKIEKEKWLLKVLLRIGKLTKDNYDAMYVQLTGEAPEPE
jgi:hypothetical protein